MKNSRKEVTVTLYSEKGRSFLKMTPTALDSRVSVIQRGESRVEEGESMVEEGEGRVEEGIGEERERR